MIDENAFGLLVSYFHIEDDEYTLERAEFIGRFQQFRTTMLDLVGESRFGVPVRVLDLGHAVYLELAQEDGIEDPIRWLRTARERLAQQNFVTVGVLAHGSRWVGEGEPAADTPVARGDATILTVSTPSEPLRRALYAETQTHPDDTLELEGWGPGLYIDTEAVEALGRKLKNAPTPLSSAGATFYRMGS
jgi:hypothetical protein